MSKFSVCLTVLLLTISYYTVHSVPIRHVVEEQQPVKVTRRETLKNTDSNLQEKFARELANAILPSYLKDLYMRFTFPAGSSLKMKEQKNAEANTIRSYENQVNGKSFTVLKAQYN